MPVVTCPKCSTKMKVPDGASGNTKCPKCATVFPVKAPAAAAFEVVDDEPPAKAPAKAEASDFEVVEDEPEAKDEKPKKRVVAADADDDDDEDDAKDKKKKKKDADDDEDEKDEKKKKDDKKKKKKKDEPDEDEWQPMPAGDRGGFSFASTGAFFVGLSLWIYLGTFVYLILLLVIAWAGASVPNVFMMIAGLLGLTNWTIGLIGCAQCLAGPSKVRGRAATALAVANIHLLVSFAISTRGTSPQSSIAAFSSLARAEEAKKLIEKLQKETDPKKRKDIEKELGDMGAGFDEDRPGRGSSLNVGDPFWQLIATQSPHSDQAIGNLFYESKGFTRQMLGITAGLLEVLRVVLMISLLGSVARAARDTDTANKSMMSMMIVLGTVLVSMIIMLIVAIILDDSKGSSKSDSPPPPPSSTPSDPMAAVKKSLTYIAVGELLTYLLHAGGLVMAAMLAMGARDAAARRA